MQLLVFNDLLPSLKTYITADHNFFKYTRGSTASSTCISWHRHSVHLTLQHRSHRSSCRNCDLSSDIGSRGQQWWFEAQTANRKKSWKRDENIKSHSNVGSSMIGIYWRDHKCHHELRQKHGGWKLSHTTRWLRIWKKPSLMAPAMRQLAQPLRDMAWGAYFLRAVASTAPRKRWHDTWTLIFNKLDQDSLASRCGK
jgi:hypothetical protein